VRYGAAVALLLALTACHAGRPAARPSPSATPPSPRASRAPRTSPPPLAASLRPGLASADPCSLVTTRALERFARKPLPQRRSEPVATAFGTGRVCAYFDNADESRRTLALGVSLLRVGPRRASLPAFIARGYADVSAEVGAAAAYGRDRNTVGVIVDAHHVLAFTYLASPPGGVERPDRARSVAFAKLVLAALAR
jgi:hypothetical protein